MLISLQPAFVLHRRRYRETSVIVELFTQDYGRISAVARGVRRAHSRTAALLQPFVPLLVSYYGKGELLTLTQIETESNLVHLSSKNLRCGFYLNELLMRLLAKNDPHAPLFAIYQQTLIALQQQDVAMNEKILRIFEKKLLVEIGYGLPLNKEVQFIDEEHYVFDLERGFLPYVHANNKIAVIRAPTLFLGKTLNALLKESFDDHTTLQEAKQLMRFIFSLLLGDRPLQSRRLF